MKPVISAAEVELLLAAAGSGPTAERNRALVALLYRAGLRIGEALALSPTDIDPRAGTMRVRRQAGLGAPVKLDDFTLGMLAAWLEARLMLGHGQPGPLFCVVGSRHGVPGAQLDQSYVRRLLGRLGRSAGLAHPLRAQTLRDSHAAELLAAGRPLDEIMERLGRTSRRATERYLAQLAQPARMAPPPPIATVASGSMRLAHRFTPGSL